MKMYNFFKVLVMAIFFSFAIPYSSGATGSASTYTSPATDKTTDDEVYSRLVTRLSEIENMDKSNLSSTEKKSLRKELKEMKKAADGLDSKVYISIGAIIIAVLLLILILR